MNLVEILANKGLKSKEKTLAIAHLLLNHKLTAAELAVEAKKWKENDKANCIEAMEIVTKTNPEIANLEFMDFVIQALEEKAPRLKWEAARVIGNIASQFPNKLKIAATKLLLNTNHKGTVVRWSAAYALGEIVKLKTNINLELIPVLQLVCEKEEKSSIKKIYTTALKLALLSK